MFEKHVINIKTYNMPMMGLSNPFVGMMPPAPNYAAMMGMSVFSCSQPTMMPMPTNIPMSMPAMPTIPTSTLPTNLNMTGTSMPSVPNYANMSGGGLMDSYMAGLQKVMSNMKYIPAPTLTFPTINFNNTSSTSSSATVSGPEAKVNLKGNGYGPEFLNKVKQIAQRLHCNYKDLLGLMNAESGINAKAKNKGSSATGLIQFMESTAKAMGTTTAALAAMSPVQQLDYVEKCIQMSKRIAGYPENATLSAGDLYALIFLPARAKQSVVASAGDGYYAANKGLDANKDGKITKDELGQRVINKRVSDSSFLA